MIGSGKVHSLVVANDNTSYLRFCRSADLKVHPVKGKSLKSAINTCENV